jgi:hypothetical protein
VRLADQSVRAPGSASDGLQSAVEYPFNETNAMPGPELAPRSLSIAQGAMGDAPTRACIGGLAMRDGEEASIFSRYYRKETLVDRYAVDKESAVDVIIPIIHTNELWRANLHSIYREIPVNRLLLGDGGCIDDSLEVAREFPRVEVLDHRNFTSLGFSIRHLIEATKTEWFVYLHSDVFLPPGWFDTMYGRRRDFDWFECNQRTTVMVDYLFDVTRVARAYSGSQMGRRAAFEKITPMIDDDYLYRNEDIIIAHLVTRSGLRYGKVPETVNFHQIMHKPSRWGRKVSRVGIDLELAPDEDLRASDTYARGIIKYVQPNETTVDIISSVQLAVDRMVELKGTTRDSFRDWVRATNPAWLPHFELGAAIQTRLAAPSGRRWRDRIADGLILFANVYRAQGFAVAVRILTIAASGPLRRLVRR